MTDVAIAVPANANPAMPAGMAYNPYLDWTPLFGIPFWFILAIGCVFVLIIIILYWVFRLGKLRGVKGYVLSAKNQTQDEIQVWLISKVQRLTIECLKIKDGVISYRDKTVITRWYHNTPLSVIRIGGVPAVIASDNFDQTRDIISEAALTYACEEFNFNQERLKQILKERRERLLQSGEEVEEEPPVIKPITDYTDYKMYGHRCLMTVNPDGIEMPSFFSVDFVRFLKYFPKGCTAGFFGGEFLRDSRKLNMTRKEPSLWEKMLPLGIVFGISIVAIMAAWMAPL